MTKTIALASDHGGFDLKEILKTTLTEQGYVVHDYGTHNHESVDYPDFAQKVAEAVASGSEQIGILVCGTGIGMSIKANRTAGIRAALVHDVTTARLARQHNDANIICLGGRIIGTAVALDCVNIFLQTEAEGGRHQQRVDKLG